MNRLHDISLEKALRVATDRQRYIAAGIWLSFQEAGFRINDDGHLEYSLHPPHWLENWSTIRNETVETWSYYMNRGRPIYAENAERIGI